MFTVDVPFFPRVTFGADKAEKPSTSPIQQLTGGAPVGTIIQEPQTFGGQVGKSLGKVAGILILVAVFGLAAWVIITSSARKVVGL